MASKPLHLIDEERRSLDDLCTCGDIHLSQRARAIVIYSTLQSMKETANKIGVSEQTVSRWVRRFRENGIEGLRVIHPGQSLSQKAGTALITQKVRELSDNSAVSTEQIVICEALAMAWVTPNMVMETKSGTAGKLFGIESLFHAVFTGFGVITLLTMPMTNLIPAIVSKLPGKKT